MYEMATGQRAFKAETTLSTILCILRDEPKSIREIRSDTPPELERLIRRCLRKEPARRIQTMSDLKVALDELKEESDSGRLTAFSPGPARKQGLLSAGIIVLSCMLLAIAAFYFSHRRVDPGIPSRPFR